MVIAEREVCRAEVTKRNFLDAIGRGELKETLTSSSPWVSVSMEIAFDQMPFTGGMGILEGDKLLQAEKSGVPFVVVTLAYSDRWRQRLEGFRQREDHQVLTPEALGLVRIAQTGIRANDNTIAVDICQQQSGNVGIIALYEEGLRELYYGSNDDQHRLYQEVVLGFGGQRALDNPLLSLSPSVIHLNESAKVFSAVAYLDKLVSGGMSLAEALSATRAKTILTNHTLVPAAVSTFSKDLYERYVFKNIASKEVEKWIEGMIDAKGGSLDLATLALELAGRFNGVSRIHSEAASGQFRRFNESAVQFEPITNGIFMERWADPRLLSLYRKSGIIDEFDLPSPDFGERIDHLDNWELGRIKGGAKNDLTQYLEKRVDQYGRSVQVPPNAKIAVWARRLAGYKRPGMVFENPQELAQILQDENMYLIIAGKAHPTDWPMKDELFRILNLVDNYPELRTRVDFVQDYDEELARHLVRGADIWLNTPKVGQEACGTSPLKAIASLTRVISTRDGGLADVDPPTYFEVKGEDYREEVDSLYFKLGQVAAENNHHDVWAAAVKKQLKAYLPIISG